MSRDMARKKEWTREYQQRPDRRAAQREYRNRPEAKARAAEYRASLKLRTQGRAKNASRRKSGREIMLFRHHGPLAAVWLATQYVKQDRRCYLCDDPLSLDKGHIDHDHGCCPSQRSCSRCRRGIACLQCNVLIGMAKDDPERLRRIAKNLERAQAGLPAREEAEVLF